MRGLDPESGEPSLEETPLSAPTPGAERLAALLSERIRNPEATARIDREILADFERRIAILVLDMCNFTEMAERRGIIHYLAMIQEMARVATPVVEANHGTVMKQHADNLFAAFPHPQAAVEAAQGINSAFRALSAARPGDHHICGCIGIGFGEAIIVGSTDFFGSEVNLACKLGEDIAKGEEILLTRAAADALELGRYRLRAVRHRISGREIEAFRFEEPVAD